MINSRKLILTRFIFCQTYLKKIQIWLLSQLEKLNSHLNPYQKKLKIYWQSLAVREQRILQGGSIFAGILLIYGLVWLPLNTHLSDLRIKIQAERKTAIWIKAADMQLQSLTHHHRLANHEAQHLSLNALEEQIRQSSISKDLSQLSQHEGNELHLSFNTIHFDTLSAWLLDLTQKQNLTIKQAAIQRINNTGSVKADVILKSE